ncbi:MAG: dimethylamine corrinoid protein 3 [Promethearchaeota archaeon]|nr:MAG: dimethylamine corrinoid protein 3 [Candidatus Lokiarchaeota archaeon]
MTSKEEIVKGMKEAILGYKKDKCLELAKQGMAEGIKPLELIQEGLTPGIQELGKKFGRGEVALPFLMVGAEAMQGALNHILENMPKGEYKPKATMILGSVKGDIHDLGISIVEAVFQANGIQVYNLGRDVMKEEFLEKAEEEDAEIIGTSALLTGTMFEQKVVIEYIKKQGLRDKYIYLIGGGACPGQEWCDEIGADGWATDVLLGLDTAKKALAEKKGIEL